MNTLLKQINECKICEKHLPYNPNPIVQASKNSKIIIIGQTPGQKVHDGGVPWEDKSGDELRRWLGVSREQFYNDKLFAHIPMGFCYPGKGKSGDLPPRPECAPQWHLQLLNKMNNVKLILLVGQYSQKYYLKTKSTLTENVKNFQNFLPEYFPLVHPSPRNKIWQKKNPWFESNIIPELQTKVKEILRF